MTSTGGYPKKKNMKQKVFFGDIHLDATAKFQMLSLYAKKLCRVYGMQSM